MNFVSLFAGVGGFDLGLERTGHKCVWANEWDKKPREVYNHNFGRMPDGRDIRDVRGRDLPEADLICGGFPCATFSYAGKRTGFGVDDTRGTLCFEMFRITRERNIPYLLFENVKGLLNHDNGRTFGIILCALDELGYDVQWELLDSQNFGVPQHRERLFLVANLRGKPRPKVFPIGKTSGENAACGSQTQSKGERIRVEDNNELKIGTLCHRLYGGNTNNVYIDNSTVEISQWRRSHLRGYKGAGTPTLTANMGTGGNNVPLVRMTNKLQLRKLTPVECERLQGLPDNFTRWLKDEDENITENSDSDRYERCGRTVTIPVIEAIGRRLGHEWY